MTWGKWTRQRPPERAPSRRDQPQRRAPEAADQDLPRVRDVAQLFDPAVKDRIHDSNWVDKEGDALMVGMAVKEYDFSVKS